MSGGEKKSDDFARLALGGAVSGLGKVPVQPFINLKTRMQVSGHTLRQQAEIWWRTEGGDLRTLFRGATLSAAKTMTAEMIKFPLTRLANSSAEVTAHPWLLMPLGAAIGGFPTMLVNPIDVWNNRWMNTIKNRAELGSSGNRCRLMLSEGRQMIRDGAAYRGVTAKIVSATPFNLIFYPLHRSIYDHMKTLHEPKGSKTESKNAQSSLTGASAAMAAATTSAITHWLDTIFRRIQHLKGKKTALVQSRDHWSDRPTNFIGMCRRVYHEEGGRSIRGFFRVTYRGVAPNVTKCFFAYFLRYGLGTTIAGVPLFA